MLLQARRHPVRAQRRRPSRAASSASAATWSRSGRPTRRSAYRIELFGDEVERSRVINPLTRRGAARRTTSCTSTRPSTSSRREERDHGGRRGDQRGAATSGSQQLKAQGKLLEAQRLRRAHALRHGDAAGGRLLLRASRTTPGTSRGRKPGEPPYTLLDFFPDDFLLIVDESHVTLPQVRGMFAGDHSRKMTLVEHGFRLPARPRQPAAAVRRVGEAASSRLLFISATPARLRAAQRPAARSSSR